MICLHFLFLSNPFSLLSFPKPYLFLAYTQTYVNKITIPNSLTIGASWNLEAWFRTYFRIGIFEIMSMVEEMSLALNFLFSRIHLKPVSVKQRSWNDQSLDRREMWTPPSEPIFTHSNRWDLQNNVFCREKLVSHLESEVEATISSLSLTFGNPNRANRGQTWGTLGNC